MVVQLHPVAMRVAELLESHVERQGFELVSVDYHKGTRSSLLRLLVDRPGGGIALSDLERLSPVLSDLLDVYDPIDGRYTLELASPGVNRPLTRSVISRRSSASGSGSRRIARWTVRNRSPAYSRRWTRREWKSTTSLAAAA